jgi:hypothetical protein
MGAAEWEALNYPHSTPQNPRSSIHKPRKQSHAYSIQRPRVVSFSTAGEFPYASLPRTSLHCRTKRSHFTAGTPRRTHIGLAEKTDYQYAICSHLLNSLANIQQSHYRTLGITLYQLLPENDTGCLGNITMQVLCVAILSF